MTAKSKSSIPKALDKAMDKQTPANGNVKPGISVAMGPVQEMDADRPTTNGTTASKRKSSMANGKS